MADDSLTSWSAVDLRRAIGNKELSPVEVLEASLERIESLNPHLNAIAGRCVERAREEARAAESAVVRGEPLGLLHGLPVGVKDLEPTEGLLTTYGSTMHRNYVPQADGAVASAVRQAGGIVVCKTNVPEFGAGGNTRNAVWGATGNPFDPELTCAGSSGGAAVALATDMLPVCTGSDTGGSLRLPAAYCGVVGYRPSPGLVPVEDRLLGWAPLSVSGPMGRTVSDTALQLAVLAGFNPVDPLSAPIDGSRFLDLRPADLGRLRVAYTTDFGGLDGSIGEVEVGIRETFLKKIAAMRHLFKTCDEVEPLLFESNRCFDVLRATNFVATHADAYRANPDNLGPNTRFNYELGTSMTLEDYANAHKLQTRLFRKFQALYSEYDLVLAPTASASPFPWSQWAIMETNGKKLENYYRWSFLTYTITLTTNPAFSLPCGLDDKSMPFGMQVIGGFRQDLRLFEIALSLEKAWSRIEELKRPLPDLSRLKSREIPDYYSMVTSAPAEHLVDITKRFGSQAFALS